MRIGDVNPGDIMRVPMVLEDMPKWGVLIAQCPHPFYNLDLFIWRLSDNTYSFDALSPEMRIDPQTVKKPENEVVRRRNLKWAVGQYGSLKPRG